MGYQWECARQVIRAFAIVHILQFTLQYLYIFITFRRAPGAEGGARRDVLPPNSPLFPFARTFFGTPYPDVFRHRLPSRKTSVFIFQTRTLFDPTKFTMPASRTNKPVLPFSHFSCVLQNYPKKRRALFDRADASRCVIYCNLHCNIYIIY